MTNEWYILAQSSLSKNNGGSKHNGKFWLNRASPKIMEAPNIMEDLITYYRGM
jgi:hypothetical protein